MIPAHHFGADMTIKERDDFTTRILMALATARADGQSPNAPVQVDALMKAHGLEHYANGSTR